MLSYVGTFGKVYFEAATQALLIVGIKGTGIDGYFTNKDTFIIEPTIEKTVEMLQEIKHENFYFKTKRSRELVSSFKNNWIKSDYY